MKDNDFKFELSEIKRTVKVGYPFNYSDIESMYNDNFKTVENNQLIVDNYTDFTSFIEDVNDNICQRFDANHGTNWDTINLAIEDILKGLN